MKKSILLCGLLTALIATTILPSRASAAAGATAWTKVEMFAASSQTGGGNWVSLADVATAGSCPTAPTPGGATKVLFMLNADDRGKLMMSLLQSAFLSGRSVLATWDTSVTIGGYCQLVLLYVK
jgi:hypothetical protein